MREIKCIEAHAAVAEDAIDEFNERREELGITKESDVISISVRPALKPMKVMMPGGEQDSTVIVSIFYWSTK